LLAAVLASGVAFVGVNCLQLSAATVNVRVYGFDFSANPKGQPVLDPVIDVGDTVHWTWESGGHNVQSVKGSIETFKTAVLPSGSTYDYTFNSAGQIVYFCLPHGSDLGNGKATGMAGTITVAYPGDANLDFKVDLSDFGILKENFGTGTTRSQGDFSHDGKVDLSDFGLLKDNFGRAPATVPEPASGWLLALGVAAWLVCRGQPRCAR
jgi:plastocyanin